VTARELPFAHTVELGAHRAQPPAISIVVMGYNNRQTISDAVGSILVQSVSDPFEVIVVTSGDDGSATLVRRRFPEITLVASESRLLPGAARNAGLAVARGHVVAFLAGDCVADECWISRRLDAHRAGYRAVASAVTLAGPNRPWAWANHYIMFSARLPGRPSGVVKYPDPAAHGLSLDQGAREKLGPFDQSLRIGEDSEAGRRLRDLGIDIWFEPSVQTCHWGPSGTVAMLRDRYHRGARQSRHEQVHVDVLGTSGVGLVRGFARRLRYKVRWTVETSWRYEQRHRMRLIVSLPWIVAGRIAGLAGYYMEGSRLSRRRRQAGP